MRNVLSTLEPLLEVRDVLGVIPLSRSKVHGLIAKGVLPSVRLPGCDRVFIHPDDLRAFVAAGRTSPANVGA